MKLPEPFTENQIKKLTLPNLRDYTLKISDIYKKILNHELIECPACKTWKSAENYYYSPTSEDHIEHYACKACILDQCTDIDNKTKTRIDNYKKTVDTFRKLDWYFDEPVYDNQLRMINEGVAEKNRGTAVQQWIVICRSLNQYKNKRFADSIFTSDEVKDTVKINQKTLKDAKKRFGLNYSNEDLMYLENEYQDWVTRYDCNTKAQEKIFERLSCKALEINKATQLGNATKDLDKTYQDLLSSINILPKQNSKNSITNSLTFGQLIEEWEEHDPVPEPDPELADVDGIGQKLRVFFSGHLSRALGLDNGYAKEYDEYMKKYTVTKPQYSGVDTSRNNTIYSQIFGSSESE